MFTLPFHVYKTKLIARDANGRRLNVVGIGAAHQEETDEDAAAAKEEEAQQDVDQGGGPEGKQVQRLVAVGVHAGRVLVVVGLVNGVDPHVTWRKLSQP